MRGKRTDITAEMINRSISQTLSRTILTSLTTLMVVVILYAMGGESIHAFAFALVVGVIVGTYSSIFVASPTLALANEPGRGTASRYASENEYRQSVTWSCFSNNRRSKRVPLGARFFVVPSITTDFLTVPG